MTNTNTTNTDTDKASADAGRWDWLSVGEQLFDRARATREGHCYARSRAVVERAIEGLTWQSVEACQTISAPMSPGEALRSVIAELRLPNVSALAWNGAVPVWDDHEGPSLYSLYGIRAHYRDGDATVYAVDRGTDCLPVTVHFLPRPTPPAAHRPPVA